MITSRTDATDYDKTPNWLHKDVTNAEERLLVTNEVEKIEEFFVWSDDKDGITDKANEIIASSEELRDLLTKLVAQSIGTGMIYSTLNDKINLQIIDTVREFAATQLENQE